MTLGTGARGSLPSNDVVRANWCSGVGAGSSASRRAAREVMPSLGNTWCRWVADRPRRQEQPCADLLVGQAGRGQRRDLPLLRRQRRRARCRPLADGQPGGRSSLPARSAHGAAPSRWKVSSGRGQLDPGIGGGLHPAEPLAVGELDPGAVERPAVGAAHGQRPFERAAASSSGAAIAAAPSTVRACRGEIAATPGLAHGRDVRRGLGLPAGPDGGLGQVQGQPQGVRYVVGQLAGPGDRGRGLVGRLEVTTGERGQRPGLAASRRIAPTRRGPPT